MLANIIDLNFKKPNKGYTTTIAGNGQTGTNDGQGTLAQFYYPHCVSMDIIGNIYVGDFCAIRMINATGFWNKKAQFSKTIIELIQKK